MGLLLATAATACQPKVEWGQFSCVPGREEACPQGLVCLVYAHEHRCFPPGDPECNNGLLEPGEQCDGSELGGSSCLDHFGVSGTLVCRPDCTVECHRCGDGVLHEPSGEQCDDGNTTSGDGCTATCRQEYCGDSVTQPGLGEQCDDGNDVAGDGCSPYCRAEGCGNGVQDYDAGEECDDGNRRSHDGCSSECRVELPLWQRWRHPLAAGRAEASMVYDAARETTLLWGGWDGLGLRDETWRYDGEGWGWESQVGAPTPARLYSPMAYDVQRERVVLFGGIAEAQNLEDTWELAGGGWVLRTPTSRPSARYGHAMAYDVARGVTVLFGGSNGTTPRGDTWEWDGSDWSLVTTSVSPNPRVEARMTYDASRQRIVLFGGLSGGTTMRSDTWEYDGSAWVETTPAVSPEGRFGFGLAHDIQRGRVVLFGGEKSVGAVGVRIADTWEYDGNAWEQVLPPVSPPARLNPGMIYDARRGRVVLYGGRSASLAMLGDLWEYDGQQWTRITPRVSPPARRFTGMACDVGRGRAVLFGGSEGERDVALADTWEYDGVLWERVVPDATPMARGGHAMAYDHGRGEVVLFGGGADLSFQTRFGDLWRYDGQAWTEAPVTGGPGLRAGAKMVYDPRDEVLRLFGGFTGFAMPSDLWELDAGGWAQATVGGADLAGRVFFDMAEDWDRDRMVVLGGYQLSGVDVVPLYDQWELSGDQWELVVPDTLYGYRNNYALTYYAPRSRVLLYGGNGESMLVDTQEYDGVTWSTVEVVGERPAVSFPVTCYDALRRVVVLYGYGAEGDETWEFGYRSGTPDEECTGGVDEDGDGLVDCGDPDCNHHPACGGAPDCLQDLTQLGDELEQRCADARCGGVPCAPDGYVCFAGACACPGGPVERDCTDGVDNDCDGDVDEADSDCGE